MSLLNSGGLGAFATRPSYSLVDLRFGIKRSDTEISLNIRNLTNAKPNLGDIGYDGYAQFNAQGSVIPQVATLQPLTVLLQYRKEPLKCATSIASSSHQQVQTLAIRDPCHTNEPELLYGWQ